MSEVSGEKSNEKAWVMRTTIGFSIAVFAVIAAAEYGSLYYAHLNRPYLAVVCSTLAAAGMLAFVKGGSDRRQRAAARRQAGGSANAVVESDPFRFLVRAEFLGAALVVATGLTYTILYYQQPKPVHIVARAKAPPAKPEPPPKPLEKAPVVFPPMKLNGLVMRQIRPAAIINSHTYFVGDHVGDAEVTSISLEGVTLEEDGEKKVLLFAK